MPAVADAGALTPTGSPMARLWDRIERPLDAPLALATLLGVGLEDAHREVARAALTSASTLALIERLPMLLRSLDQTLTVRLERTSGEVRGPINWAETIAARATSGGAGDAVVCGSPARETDTPLNRTLVSVLERLGQLGPRLGPESAQGSPRIVRAREVAHIARRTASSKALSPVARGRITTKDRSRARSARAAPRYAEVFDVDARLAEPLDPDGLGGECDPITTRRHELLVAVLEGLERRCGNLPAMSCAGGVATCGPVEFRHHDRPGASPLGPGVSLAGVMLDVADETGTSSTPGAWTVRTTSDLDGLLDRYVASR